MPQVWPHDKFGGSKLYNILQRLERIMLRMSHCEVKVYMCSPPKTCEVDYE